MRFDEDFHVHSTFSDGASTLAENVAAAHERGLRTLGLVDHVRRDTAWLPAFTAAVAALREAEQRSHSRLRLLAGVEAKILDTAGRLDLPPDLDGIDLVLIADHQFPGDNGPVHPERARAAIDSGALSAAEAVERLCAATEKALYATDRDRVVAHLFSVLPKIGLDEAVLPDALLVHLAARVAEAGAMVEINEKWACPAPRTVVALARAGVTIVASTDSHHCRDVGNYPCVRQTAAAADPGLAAQVRGT